MTTPDFSFATTFPAIFGSVLLLFLFLFLIIVIRTVLITNIERLLGVSAIHVCLTETRNLRMVGPGLVQSRCHLQLHQEVMRGSFIDMLNCLVDGLGHGDNLDHAHVARPGHHVQLSRHPTDTCIGSS